jgi:hypothetical protein
VQDAEICASDLELFFSGLFRHEMLKMNNQKLIKHCAWESVQVPLLRLEMWSKPTESCPEVEGYFAYWAQLGRFWKF